MEPFQLLHAAILRRNESQQLNEFGNMFTLYRIWQIPRTMNATMVHITNTQQTKVNYV